MIEERCPNCAESTGREYSEVLIDYAQVESPGVQDVEVHCLECGADFTTEMMIEFGAHLYPPPFDTTYEARSV